MLAGLAAAAGTWAASARWRNGVREIPRTLLHSVFLSMIYATELLGLVFVFILLSTRHHSRRTFRSAVMHVFVAWLVLLALTPWYHPYVRLWLPIEAFGWMLMSGAFVEMFRRPDSGTRPSGTSARARPLLDPVVALGAICLFVFFGIARSNPTSAKRISTMFAPSDSLRRACKSIPGQLPGELNGLRLYARPCRDVLPFRSDLGLPAAEPGSTARARRSADLGLARYGDGAARSRWASPGRSIRRPLDSGP